MYEQDYIMRLTREMVRAILKLAFNIDTDSPTADLLSEREQKETLEEHNYSRDEIRTGLKSIAADYGLSSIVEMF